MIKRKKDIENFLYQFCLHAKWDGMKFYMIINDITLMQYPEGKFTIHRKNEFYWDLYEKPVVGEELTNFIWQHRKYINQLLKSTFKEVI